jgi:hypothetical protein
MKIISHRGNINGRNIDLENDPVHIENALNSGYDVEIDVWYKNDKLYLGHDAPEHEVDLDYLNNKKFWCHAKNLAALKLLLDEKIHCFWHQEDDYTVTSKGYIWTYPEKHITSRSVIVCRDIDRLNEFETNPHGVCIDNLNILNML